MQRILMIEDDEDQARHLSALLDRYAREQGFSLAVTRYASALEFINTRQEFDLIFLDIRLPGINGMEAAQALRSYDTETPIVFVTDLARYAVDGYKVGAFDFVVKPVTYGELSLCMDRIMRELARSAGRNVCIPTRDGVRVIPTDKVIYLDVRRHDLTYHLVEDEQVTVRQTITKAEENLTGLPFVRVSNSCLANMRHIRTIKGAELTMSNGNICLVSKSRRKSVLETIANFYGRNS